MLRHDALDFAAFFKSWTVMVRWPFAAVIIWSSVQRLLQEINLGSEQATKLVDELLQSKRSTQNVSLPGRVRILEGLSLRV